LIKSVKLRLIRSTLLFIDTRDSLNQN